MDVDITKMQREEKTVFRNVKTTSDETTGVYDVVKRGLDVTAALLGMILLSPLYVFCFVWIKLEDGGPVIFSQERIGYKGQKFLLYKFRSMIPEAEKEGVPQLCERDDARLTKIGRFLREHHLDELPQLWNVLKGEMSFVGPRPERAYFVEQIMAINPDYRLLFHLRPGLFSMATLYNGYTDTMEKMLIRLRMDLDYLEHRNLWLDVKIILLTMCYLLGGKKF